MKKTLCILCMLLCVMSILCACQDNKQDELPYGAKLYDKAENLLGEDFLSENKTHYPFMEDNLPENRCHIIKNNDDFSFAFTSFPEELDFSQDTLIVYLFTDIYYGFGCKLKEIIENEDEIVIVIEHDSPKNNEPLSSMPIQRGFVVKLCNCDIDNLKIKLIYSK